MYEQERQKKESVRNKESFKGSRESFEILSVLVLHETIAWGWKVFDSDMLIDVLGDDSAL